MGECSAVEDYARRGARPPPGSGRGEICRAKSLYQPTTPPFQPLVCRHKRARATGTKMPLPTTPQP